MNIGATAGRVADHAAIVDARGATGTVTMAARPVSSAGGWSAFSLSEIVRLLAYADNVAIVGGYQIEIGYKLQAWSFAGEEPILLDQMTVIPVNSNVTGHTYDVARLGANRYLFFEKGLDPFSFATANTHFQVAEFDGTAFRLGPEQTWDAVANHHQPPLYTDWSQGDTEMDIAGIDEHTALRVWTTHDYHPGGSGATVFTTKGLDAELLTIADDLTVTVTPLAAAAPIAWGAAVPPDLLFGSDVRAVRGAAGHVLVSWARHVSASNLGWIHDLYTVTTGGAWSSVRLASYTAAQTSVTGVANSNLGTRFLAYDANADRALAYIGGSGLSGVDDAGSYDRIVADTAAGVAVVDTQPNPFITGVLPDPPFPAPAIGAKTGLAPVRAAGTEGDPGDTLLMFAWPTDVTMYLATLEDFAVVSVATGDNPIPLVFGVITVELAALLGFVATATDVLVPIFTLFTSQFALAHYRFGAPPRGATTVLSHETRIASRATATT